MFVSRLVRVVERAGPLFAILLLVVELNKRWVPCLTSEEEGSVSSFPILAARALALLSLLPCRVLFCKTWFSFQASLKSSGYSSMVLGIAMRRAFAVPSTVAGVIVASPLDPAPPITSSITRTLRLLEGRIPEGR